MSLCWGRGFTLVGAGYGTLLCVQAAEQLARQGISCEVVDLRVTNPLDLKSVIQSVRKTGAICAVDGGCRSCGLAGEVLAQVGETLEPGVLKKKPVRVTLPYAPAPTSAALEKIYYVTVEKVVEAVLQSLCGS